MIRKALILLLSFLLMTNDNPVYSEDISSEAIEKYTIQISKKFSNTYCNTTKFGISNDGALKFAIGETNKEFLNKKFNKFIDHNLLNKNILLGLGTNCQVYDFPLENLENLIFK